MLAAGSYQSLFPNIALPKHQLLEVHHGQISLHQAKAGYGYPTIRLPHTFNSLVGLSTKIFQTVCEGDEETAQFVSFSAQNPPPICAIHLGSPLDKRVVAIESTSEVACFSDFTTFKG
jgi:hypothetical protein